MCYNIPIESNKANKFASYWRDIGHIYHNNKHLVSGCKKKKKVKFDMHWTTSTHTEWFGFSKHSSN